ncbi:MAG: HD domain-containing protein [Thermodesulfobacteriota bacterium]
MMNPYELIEDYYRPGSKAHAILVRHSEQVAEKAVAIAERVRHLQPDIPFIHEAALLHDIGIVYTRASKIGCHGAHRYVAHGYLGRLEMDKRGFPRHALVCERHVGVGITAEEIRRYRLPLPARDMLPVSLEEKIVCFADKFYSKDSASGGEEKTLAQVIASLLPFGQDKADRFQEWAEFFDYR